MYIENFLLLIYGNLRKQWSKLPFTFKWCLIFYKLNLYFLKYLSRIWESMWIGFCFGLLWKVTQINVRNYSSGLHHLCNLPINVAYLSTVAQCIKGYHRASVKIILGAHQPSVCWLKSFMWDLPWPLSTLFGPRILFQALFHQLWLILPNLFIISSVLYFITIEQCIGLYWCISMCVWKCEMLLYSLYNNCIRVRWQKRYYPSVL